MSQLRSLGTAGEDQAADYLLAHGYTIVTRRYHAPHGEIDLVCLDGDVLVFVEVKLRLAPGYSPEGAIGPKKQSALVSAADHYMRVFETTRERRFDMIAIDRTGLRHHRNLFTLGETY